MAAFGKTPAQRRAEAKFGTDSYYDCDWSSYFLSFLSGMMWLR